MEITKMEKIYFFSNSNESSVSLDLETWGPTNHRCTCHLSSNEPCTMSVISCEMT